MNDNDYIKGILQNDFDIYRKIRLLVFPSIRKILGKKSAEKDVEVAIQDVVIEIYEKAQSPDFKLTGKFKSFFCSICRNKHLNKWQKIKSAEENTSVHFAKYNIDQHVIPDSDFANLEQGILLSKAMMRLGEECRQLLQLYYLEELSRKKTAQKMNYSETHVSHKNKDCREKLKKLIMSFPEYLELYGD